MRDSQYRISACMPVGSMISGGCSSANTWQCFKSRLDIVIGKLRLGSKWPGRFKLTGAWCEELLSQMKHAFLFVSQRNWSCLGLRSNCRQQRSRSFRLRIRSYKPWYWWHLIFPLGTKPSCWALGSSLPTSDLRQHTSARHFSSVKWNKGWPREILSKAGGDLTSVSALWGHCS